MSPGRKGDTKDINYIDVLSLKWAVGTQAFCSVHSFFFKSELFHVLYLLSMHMQCFENQERNSAQGEKLVPDCYRERERKGCFCFARVGA